MKILNVSIYLVLLFSVNASKNFAQSTSDLRHDATLQPQKPSHKAYRKTTVSEPLLSVSNYSYDGEYKIIDSNVYDWSNDRTSLQQKIPLTEVITTDFDTSTLLNIHRTGSIDYNSRLIQTFNLDGLISESIQQGWDSHAWVTNEIVNYTYSGLLLQEKVVKIWETATPLERRQYLYLAGVLDNIVVQYWDASSLTWYNTNRITYTYSGTDTSEILYENWELSKWRKSYRINYKYSSGKMIENQEQEWDEINSIWGNQIKRAYTYVSGNLENELLYIWNPYTAVWEKNVRYYFIYSGTNLISESYEIWNNSSSSWKPQTKYLYEYAGSNVSKMSIQYWDTSSKSLENTQQFVHHYNSKNALIETFLNYWYGGKWQPRAGANSALKKYYYTSSTNINDQNMLFESGVLFPNPAQNNKNSILKFFTNASINTKITLYNQLGQNLIEIAHKTIKGSNSVIIPTQSLMPGTYYLQLSDDKYQQNFILVK